jgi:sarcosine oxidase subunit beta
MKNRYDSIVVGGGIIGASVLYNLSKKGQKVLLVEKNDICSGTSGACDAYITPHTKKPGKHLDFCMESQKLYEKLEEELGVELEYVQKGGFTPCADEMSFQLVSDNSKKLLDGGLFVKMMNIDEVREYEPNLSPDLVGALHCPSASQINPFRVVYGYLNNAKKMGAEVMTQTEVTELIKEGNAIKGIRTNNGDYYSDMVINCAGCWGSSIAEMAGTDLVIKPRRGQLVVTEASAPLINTTMQGGNYMIVKHHPELINDEKMRRLGCGFAIEQTADGTILIGFTREFAEYDKNTTLEAIEAIVQEACIYIPELKNLHIIRTFSGFRPYVKDGLPFLGTVDGIDGFFMAAGHEGDGVALAPITGKIVSEMIVDGESSFGVAEFSPNRNIS